MNVNAIGVLGESKIRHPFDPVRRRIAVLDATHVATVVFDVSSHLSMAVEKAPPDPRLLLVAECPRPRPRGDLGRLGGSDHHSDVVGGHGVLGGLGGGHGEESEKV